MKICIAQTKPITGNIEQNIARHKEFIELAALYDAAVIIFPELSLTGYEPSLAKALAVDVHDHRFEDFQIISNTKKIIIGTGIPVRTEKGIVIGMIIFQPNHERLVYAKKYIHADEEGFFVPGQNFPTINMAGDTIALAICYELSVQAHADEAFRNGATIYIASVAKFTNGVDKATQRLSEIARSQHVFTLMANSVGPADGALCAGKTAVWSPQGEVLAQLDESHEGIVILNTESKHCTLHTL